MAYDAITVAHEVVTHETTSTTITTITMNRPDRRNALSTDLMLELTDALRAVGSGNETRVVILAANGPAFSAGHDLRELVD
ncbi:MAG TPA: enoyl-CoA hydratase-related protein, partial [Ktedonobacterales bacterium]